MLLYYNYNHTTILLKTYDVKAHLCRALFQKHSLKLYMREQAKRASTST